jgi:hypothetical protein
VDCAARARHPCVCQPYCVWTHRHRRIRLQVAGLLVVNLDNVVAQPDPDTFSVRRMVPTAATCNSAADGAVAVTVEVGEDVNWPFIDFVWTKDGAPFAPPTEVNTVVQGPASSDWSTVITDLAGGLYVVTATTGSGRSVVRSATVSESAALISSIVPTAVTCNSGADGAVELTVGGGSGGNSFLDKGRRWVRTDHRGPRWSRQRIVRGDRDRLERVQRGGVGHCV